MPSERLRQQIAFVREVDALKSISRQTWLLNQHRKENDAEHSWHITVMALLLQEYAPTEIDVPRVLHMMLIHDLVEIDAGDVLVYDEAARAAQHERERAAAERIFGILPADQAASWRAVWDEFEARETPEARYARALDRLQPLLHNLFTEGRAWREHGIRHEQVIATNAGIGEGAPELWDLARALIDQAVAAGHLAE